MTNRLLKNLATGFPQDLVRLVIEQVQNLRFQPTAAGDSNQTRICDKHPGIGNKTKPSLYILGSRGIPANYGGFETFAERLSLYLVSQGWEVTVYCQDESKKEIEEEEWNSIRLIHIPSSSSNAIGTIIFDWKSTLHAAKQDGIMLTLGYNTAIFSFWYALKGVTNLINMDGMEWHRQKWNALEKTWLFMNERIGSWLADRLIADHPEIKAHLATHTPPEKITVIPYGAEPVIDADSALLEPYNLIPNQYILIVARAEPENSILEIVSAFSRKTRNRKLVVLGRYFPDVLYHKKVMEAASDEVVFLGSIYDKAVISALRFYGRLYVHGHTVGGTNPALVEALAAGMPVLAQDNRFNRWVAGSGAGYFKDENECDREFDRLLDDQRELQTMKLVSLEQYHQNFSRGRDLKAYESLLLKLHSKSRHKV